MNIKTALLGFALLGPATMYATDASAFAKCDKMEDEKKQAKCVKKETKRITKLRAKTTAMVPSSLNPGFASLDADDANPFNSDDYYTPGYEPLNIEAVDQVLGGVARINGAITMATYVGALHKEGKTAEAKKLASALLPELIKIKSDIDGIKEGIQKIQADPASLATENPMAVPKIVKGTATAVGQLPGLIADLPKALSAIKPLAAGAAGAAANAAAGKVKAAAGEAAGAAGDAAGAAGDAAEKATEAAEAASGE